MTETIKPFLIGYEVEELKEGYCIHNFCSGWLTSFGFDENQKYLTKEEIEQLKKGEKSFSDLYWK